MRDDAVKRAQDAWLVLDAQAQDAVLGLLCRSRPEAVLAAVEEYERHQRVIAGLLQRGPSLG